MTSLGRNLALARWLGLAAVAAFPPMAPSLSPALAGPASGDRSAPETPLSAAREESGVTNPPRSRHELPAGELRVSSELLAGRERQKVRLVVKLNSSVDRGALIIRLPERWLHVSSAGLTATRPARLEDTVGGRARLTRSGRHLELSFRRARAGDEASLEIPDLGIPAGEWPLPWRWRGRGGTAVDSGTVRVVLYAPSFEAAGPTNRWARLAAPGFVSNATASQPGDQNEPFIAVPPYDGDRLLVGVNPSDQSASTTPAFISSDAGQTWRQLNLSPQIDAPGKAVPEVGPYCCDPMFAADNLGNVWFGGLTFGSALGTDPNNPGRIIVNRIAAGSEGFRPFTVGLGLRPQLEPTCSPSRARTVDKPMMTIDNALSSPTYGRLYAVANDRCAGMDVIIWYCDTRPEGVVDATRCDEADNWSKPVAVTPARSSVNIQDVAVGPDGKVYVVWWDFSNANAIRGAVCDPAAADCGSHEGYGGVKDIAILNSLGGRPLPSGCEIAASPASKLNASPSVEVDTSDGPSRGRVYVSWNDLREGSGQTRCAGDSSSLTFDSFVASASGELPGASRPSAAVGTRLYTDAEIQQPPEADSEGRPAASGNSDEFFPWLTVDQGTGQAWADFYSTRDDGSRRTTHFYLRSIAPTAGGHSLGPLTRVSPTPADFSTQNANGTLHDYGDYTGLDAAEGSPFPVWISRRGDTDDGDAYVLVPDAPSLQLVHRVAGVAEDSGADGDGLIEPGEPIVIFERIANPSRVGATNVRGALVAPPKSTATQPTSPYPDIAAGAEGVNSIAFRARLADDLRCGAPVDFRVDLRTDQGPESVVFLVPACSATSAAAPGTAGAEAPRGASPPPERAAGGRFLISRRSVRLTPGGVARVQVACRQPTPCRGTLRLRIARRLRQGGRVERSVLGRRTFAVSPRRRTIVSVQLSRASRRLLDRPRAARVLAIATLRLEAGASVQRRSTATASFRLRRSRASGRP